ncbi:MAG: hypothetical protein WCE54_10750 [Ignavibacteriaceae bacterium]
MKIKTKAIIFFVLLIPIPGCVKLPDDVVAPQWDTEFNIPITNKTYKLAEIIKPQKYIGLDSDSSYIFYSDTYNYSTGVAEYLDQSSETNSEDDDIIASNNETDVYLEFPGKLKLSKADFKKGNLKFYSLNKSNSESVTINIRIPGLKDPSGQVITSQLNLAPGDSGSVIKLLNDSKYIKPSYQPDSLDNGLLVKITASSNSNIAETHVGFVTSGFIFRSATGYLPPKTLNQISNSLKFDLGNDISNFKGNIFLTGARLKLKAEYISSHSDPFELELRNLQVTGKSLSDNQQSQLVFKNTGGNSSPASTTINVRLGTIDTVFDESNSSIDDFISSLPDEMDITTLPVMNPDDDKTYKTVTEEDSIEMKSYLTTQGIELNSNAMLSIRRSTLKDTVEMNIDQSDRNSILDGKSANLNIQVNNYIPLTSWIKIILTDHNYNRLATITKGADGGDSLRFLGAQIGSNGLVTAISKSQQTINLDSTQIASLANAYYAILSVSLETSSLSQNPAHVILKASDWVEIIAAGTIKYNVNPGK